jgi:hypothetical protein
LMCWNRPTRLRHKVVFNGNGNFHWAVKNPPPVKNEGARPGPLPRSKFKISVRR